MKTRIITLISVICIASFVNKDMPVDFLNLPGPLEFDHSSYNFVWSSPYQREYAKIKRQGTGAGVSTGAIKVSSIMCDARRTTRA